MSREIVLRTVPTVALRGMTVFPGMQLHFEVSRKQSVAALHSAMEADREVFLVMQRDIRTEEPKTVKEFFPMGVICKIKQIFNTPKNENMRVAVEGLTRARIAEVHRTTPYLTMLVS